jgi:signal transduction histidine kinase
VPLAALLNAARAMAEPQARQQQAHIEEEPVSAELAVLADPHALQQVLLNLLSNGIRYNRRRGTLRVIARRVGGQVAIGRLRRFRDQAAASADDAGEIAAPDRAEPRGAAALRPVLPATLRRGSRDGSG